MQYFEYGEEEIDYLKKKDKKLGEAMDRLGLIKREIDPNLFSALINSIVSQQISMKAAETVWRRFVDKFGEATSERLRGVNVEELQTIGISFRKAAYIQNIAEEVASGRFSIDELVELPDEEVAKRLSSLKGVGIWTAEMLMIFSMGRKNILSWDDLGIRRGIMKLYHHKTLTRERFEKYRKRYAPYGTVASMYLWAISLEK